MLYPFAFVLAVALLCIHSVAKSKKRQRALDRIAADHGCEPPPMLENQRPFGLDRLEQIFRADAESRLMELFLFHFRQTGYTLQQMFLRARAFGTVDPANLEAIFSSRAKDWSFGPRRQIAFPMFGDGIFTQEGPAWKHSRDLLRPHLAYKKYEDLKVFVEPIDDLLRVLPQDGGVVDLQPFFFRFTLDVATAFLFGDSIHSLQSTETRKEKDFALAFDLAQKYIVKRFRLLDLYFLIGGSKFHDACSRVQTFADEIIERNLLASIDEHDTDNNRYVFLKSVAEAFPDRASLRGQIISLLVAGRDTTACLLSWTFFLLVRHPRVMEKVRNEILELENGLLDRSRLRNLRYLQNVLKETLRLYPPVPVNSRTAIANTVLPKGGGPDGQSPVLVPKGCAVAFSVYALHRRPDFYGMDAECFRPERWEEDLPLFESKTTANYGYLPFSGGPRSCLGMDFALTEAAFAIVRILQRYPNIRLPANEKAGLVGTELQKVTLVLQIAGGCKVDLG